jgi:hypothetical protein
MLSRTFSDVLRDAITGDPDSIEAILGQYMPLFNKQSILGGELDEDLRQYIMLRVILLIPKFNPEQ